MTLPPRKQRARRLLDYGIHEHWVTPEYKNQDEGFWRPMDRDTALCGTDRCFRLVLGSGRTPDRGEVKPPEQNSPVRGVDPA